MLPNASHLALIAVILLPTAACGDGYASGSPPNEPSAQNAPSPAEVALLESQLRETEAKLAATRAAASASERAPRPYVKPKPGAPLPAFISNGEQRIECPVGYHAKEAENVGCECASSTDGSTVSATSREAACSTTARAEADECIFTCPAEAPSTE